MSFLRPTAFALAALILVIVAMYLLKPRRPDHVVSSVYLWQRLVRDESANALWQRLRRNLLLLLQILILSTLTLALARPYLPTDSAADSLIIVIDVSTSMAATDVDPNRLEVARAQAVDLIAGLPNGARIAVIAASRPPEVVLAQSVDPRRAVQAVRDLRVVHGGSDLTTALTLAGAIAAREDQAQIVVLSDGGGNLSTTELPAPVRYVPIGQDGNNQAVAALDIRELAGGQAVSLFARVTNYGRGTASRRLDIYVDGQLYDARPLTLPAGESKTVLRDDLPANTQQVEVVLAGHDGLADDDRAFAVRAAATPASVLLVSEGNRFLETAFGLLPNVELSRIAPADFARSPTGHDPQLVVFDGTVPDDFPDSNLLFIAPPTATPWFAPSGSLEQPTVHVANAEHPVLRYVDFSRFHVLRATAIPLPKWAQTAVVADLAAPPRNGDGTMEQPWPLLFTGEVAGRRVAVLAFDLRDSDFVLRPGFPLLISNLVEFLAPGAGGLVPTQVQAGQAVVIPIAPATERVTFTLPDGQDVSQMPEGGRVAFGATHRLGIYGIDLLMSDGAVQRRRFAVNVFSPEESAIMPRASLPIAGGSTHPPATASSGRRELWRPLAMAALLILLVEWLFYHRTASTRILVWFRPSARGTASRRPARGG